VERKGNGTIVLDPDNSPSRVKVITSPAGPSVDPRIFARRAGSTYERALPGYREVALRSVRVFGGKPGYQRIFVHRQGSGTGKRLVSHVESYYVEGEQAFRAAAATPGRVLSDGRVAKLRALVAKVRLPR
jgi:hypothetical protein